MTEEALFAEINSYLVAEATHAREEKLLDSGILLALLVLRGVTTGSETIEIRPQDRDARRLFQYLIEPGLAPDLASVEQSAGGVGGPGWTIRPHWDRIASFYGKDPADFAVLLRDRFPKVVQRHRLTIAFLLSGD